MKCKLIFQIVVLVQSCVIFSQKRIEQKAEKAYEKLAYVNAIKTYERLVSKGYVSVEILEKLADSYYFKADYEKAAQYYSRLIDLNQEVYPEYYYRYALTLKTLGNYKKADEMMVFFADKRKQETRALLIQQGKEYLKTIEKNSGFYSIENTEINTKYADFGGAFLENKLVFASARDTGSIGKRVHSWTGEHFTELYESEWDEEGKLHTPTKCAGSINSKFNESSLVATRDGKTIYFTRNNYNDGKKGKDSLHSTLLKIYKSTWQENHWGKCTELPFNSNQYSVAHPALSVDEKTLYFASNMPGSYGQSDLYKVSINDDGSYGTPINLGPTINTEGRETFPYISTDGFFYFASDGHPGLGGLDVFQTKIASDGTIQKIINLGTPINSPFDDFAFVMAPNKHFGFVSSNRSGGKGNDDIYRIKPINKICTQSIRGLVLTKGTEVPSTSIMVGLYDNEHRLIKTITADSKGNFVFDEVACHADYAIRVEGKDFETKEEAIRVEDEGIEKQIQINETIQVLKVGDDLSKVFNIKNIYFDLDRFEIRPDAAVELAKILDVLEAYPHMSLAIRSHTDCRNRATYNLILSENRAKATLEWLVSKGINASRLTAKGFGETQLINACACEPINDSNCTEAQHQANRRSEFLITKL